MPGRTFFPTCQNSFAAAPLVLTPFVRNQLSTKGLRMQMNSVANCSVMVVLKPRSTFRCIVIFFGTQALTANLRTKILDFRGFDSSKILSSRGGILRPIGNFPESSSQAILAGIILVGRLGVGVATRQCLSPCLPPQKESNTNTSRTQRLAMTTNIYKHKHMYA